MIRIIKLILRKSNAKDNNDDNNTDDDNEEDNEQNKAMRRHQGDHQPTKKKHIITKHQTRTNTTTKRNT